MKKSKKILLSVLAVLLALVLAVAGYCAYILLSYYRIEDNLKLEVTDGTNAVATTNTTYKISTYNVGFGAYSQDYSFFLDSGYNPDGSVVSGKHSTARSKDECLFNTNGAIAAATALDVDFALFQEVDVKSTRSYKIDQYQLIKQAFDGYDTTFASNFHTAFLPYPLHDMHGKVNAGLATFSKYNVTNSVRKSFTVATDLSKLFDLDRCFSANFVPVDNGKTLVIVNVHMSAYDKGGVIRQAQKQELSSFLQEMAKEGHYVIVGGDYNHDLLAYNPSYSYTQSQFAYKGQIQQLRPDWLQQFFDQDGNHGLPSSYTIVASDNAPTCRDASVEWQQGFSFVTTIDGFIVSSNVKVVDVQTVVTKNGNKGVDGFAFSDHDPVLMQFELL